jgi:hypothetical protein
VLLLITSANPLLVLLLVQLQELVFNPISIATLLILMYVSTTDVTLLLDVMLKPRLVMIAILALMILVILALLTDVFSLLRTVMTTILAQLMLALTDNALTCQLFATLEMLAQTTLVILELLLDVPTLASLPHVTLTTNVSTLDVITPMDVTLLL